MCAFRLAYCSIEPTGFCFSLQGLISLMAAAGATPLSTVSIFSSTSALLGPAGQANYAVCSVEPRYQVHHMIEVKHLDYKASANRRQLQTRLHTGESGTSCCVQAANAALGAWADQQHAAGVAATSIMWGAWAAGMAAVDKV